MGCRVLGKVYEAGILVQVPGKADNLRNVLGVGGQSGDSDASVLRTPRTSTSAATLLFVAGSSLLQVLRSILDPYP